jgi:hypothetical protein
VVAPWPEQVLGKSQINVSAMRAMRPGNKSVCSPILPLSIDESKYGEIIFVQYYTAAGKLLMDLLYLI